MQRLQIALLGLLAAVRTNRAAAETGGDKTDPNFVCKSSTFLSSAESCQTQNCSPSDLTRIFTLGLQLCVPVGGTADNGLFNLSACAQPGLATAKAQSGCSDTDWKCICSNPAFTVGAAEYEEQHSSLSDVEFFKFDNVDDGKFHAVFHGADFHGRLVSP
ncbi:hypothetical protein G7Y79_00034g069140 [Physcia stellaris]|nr:hypothetical protein G7Y79_00034g069140 [Physcia stellaris]